MNSSEPALNALRKLLVDLFKIAVDFERFYGDRFPDVWRLAGSRMERHGQISLLFAWVQPQQIVHALVDHFLDQPQRLREIEKGLAELDSPQQREWYAAIEERDQLEEERARQQAQGVSTVEVSRQLKALKAKIRELRDGPGLQAGDVLSDRYKLLIQIGRGGFATVWQAFDMKDRCVVAIRVLHVEQARSPHSRDRFDRGARSMRRFTHRHIIGLITGVMEDQKYYFVVLEYAAGGDLAGAIRNFELAQDSRFGKDAAFRAVLQIAEALSFLHKHGRIHRDVKPANILLTKAGDAKLTDFDLVRDDASSGNTSIGGLGTPLYAAPEQRENASDVDRRADVYSLGMTAVCVVYGSLLRDEMFDRDGREAFIDKLNCPKALRNVLRKAVDPEREKRYQTMDALRTDLERAAGPWLHPKPAPSQSTRLLAVIVTIACVSVVAAATSVEYFGERENRPDQSRPDWGLHRFPLDFASESGLVILWSPPPLDEPGVKLPVNPPPGISESVGVVTPVKPKPVPSDPPAVPPPEKKQVDPPPEKNQVDPPLEKKKKKKKKSDQSQAESGSDANDQLLDLLGEDLVPPTKQSEPVKPTAPTEKTPDEILAEARKAFTDGEKDRAIKLALQAADRPGLHQIDAWRFAGAAACSIKNVEIASRAYVHLDSPEHKGFLAELCQRNGLFLDQQNGQFRPAE